MLRDFTTEKFDIIIQAGQSNSDGTGHGPTEDPYFLCDKIWYMTNDLSISMAQEQVIGNDIRGNFAIPFARQYLRDGRLAEDRKILILRTAIGGTGFRDHRWGMTDDLYLKMMEMIREALAMNPENRLVAFLWHQGETDAVFHAPEEEYYANLSGLVKSVRDTFQVPEIPFVCGDFVRDWKSQNEEICKPVIDATKRLCADLVNARFVETAHLKSNNETGTPEGDIIHFNRAALYELGLLYYAAFVEMITK